MSFTNDINELPVAPEDMMPGHLDHHATIHSALQDHNSRLNTVDTRASFTWSYVGTGVPKLSDYPGIKFGDRIVRKSDGYEWRVDL